MSDDPNALTLEKMLRTIGRVEAELRWMHGRRVVALKVGRRTSHEIRDALRARATQEDTAPLLEDGPNRVAGIPVYVCDATDHVEKVYADEDLKARLKDAPAALP